MDYAVKGILYFYVEICKKCVPGGIGLRKHHLHAAKISINENIFSQNLNELKVLLFEGLRTCHFFLEEYNSYWNFIEVQPTKINNRDVIVGRLCRGKDEYREVVDLDIAKLKRDNVENVATLSNFIFDYQTEIVVFEERRGRISKYQFINMFKQLILTNASELGRIESEFIPAGEDLKNGIRQFSSINFASFELIPANWNDDDDFSILDEELKGLNANKAKQHYESKDGINTDSRLFKQPVNMILAGYGKFIMKGKDLEGARKQLHSDKELLYDVIETSDDFVMEVGNSYYNFLMRAINQHLGASKDDE